MHLPRPARAAAVVPMACAVLLLTGCGTEPAPREGEAAALPSTAPPSGEPPSGEPLPEAVPEEAPADPWAERHAENDAFRSTLGLDPAEQRRGDAEAERTAAALEPVRAAGDITARGVDQALRGLGYAPDAIVTGSFGTEVTFVVALYPVCLEGGVTPEAVRVEAHGVYMEGGCQEPAGGH